MAANQEYIRQVSTVAGCQAKVNVETDAAYNNRLQSGFEAATQSFSQMIEQDTCKKLVLAMQTANKSCSKKKNATIGIETVNRILVLLKPFPIVNQSWCKKIENIHMEGKVEVQSVTSDASTQIEKAYVILHYSKKVIRHYKCFVHKIRKLQKQLKKYASLLSCMDWTMRCT